MVETFLCLEVLRAGGRLLRCVLLALSCLSPRCCSIMYHCLTGLAMGSIWRFPTALGQPNVENLMLGVALGAVGAAAAYVFLKVRPQPANRRPPSL
jgi:hypothetical protein